MATNLKGSLQAKSAAFRVTCSLIKAITALDGRQDGSRKRRDWKKAKWTCVHLKKADQLCPMSEEESNFETKFNLQGRVSYQRTGLTWQWPARAQALQSHCVFFMGAHLPHFGPSWAVLSNTVTKLFQTMNFFYTVLVIAALHRHASMAPHKAAQWRQGTKVSEWTTSETHCCCCFDEWVPALERAEYCNIV